MKRLLVAFALSMLGCETASPPQSSTAQPPAAEPAALPPLFVSAEMSSLVANERSENPERFEAFARVVRRWRGVRSPGRDQALLSHWLRSLGKAGAVPMIDLLAVSGFAEPLHAPERISLQTAVTEALARLDDPRSTAVLRALFERAEPTAVRAAAARGIARSCRDEELSLLLAHADHHDARVDAAIAGLGRCLRLPAAEHLVTLLEGAPDSARAARIATALGTLASELVWRAPSRRNDPDREKIRALAADALNRASSRFSQLHEIDRALGMIR